MAERQEIHMINTVEKHLTEVAERIRELRTVLGMSVQEAAQRTGLSEQEYLFYEAGTQDLPFSFIHNCALAFDVDMAELLEGRAPMLRHYQVTRGGEGQTAVDDDGILIRDLAPRFSGKLAEPYIVRYEYDEEQQHKPIHTDVHSGQEFDYILSGSLKVQIGSHVEVLSAGDSILYDSGTPHGMIAVDGAPCSFLAVVLAGEKAEEEELSRTIVRARTSERLLCESFVQCSENEQGTPTAIAFENADQYNFAFDTVDAIGRAYPDKLAMVYVPQSGEERRFTFGDIKRASSQTANYFKSLGIGRGDRVMLVLRRHYQFWFCMLALHKLGAVAIPATDQLQVHDYEYRFQAAGVSAIVCTAQGKAAEYVEQAAQSCDTLKTKIMVGGARFGWYDFDASFKLFSSHFDRGQDAPCGDDTALMFFTSGTTGYPKIAEHSYKYALGHYLTARYWHQCDRDGLHFTISDTGWGKALWGKFYGQWMCEGAVFVYDFDRFDAHAILPMFAKYHITTFCAPPTMLRMLIREDLSQYDLSSIRNLTTAGEALNPEVHRIFRETTGLSIMEGFGQTETTLTVGTFQGMKPRPGAMGKPSPLYDVDIVDENGQSVPVGETGEIVVRTDHSVPCGLFKGYYRDAEHTQAAWHDGMYHTGDTAWRDEDGYYWYVGRVDDVIKSSGYRIGPFEIENVIMELPYVLECGVSAVKDEVRGQVVKASIVLTRGTEGTEELKKEIQQYVKTHTAPYKYPRIVVFRDSLPKTISGKIQRNLL